MGDKIRKVSDLLVEKLAAGQLPPDEEAGILDLLRMEEGGMARLEAIEKSNEEILGKYPPAQMVKEIRRKFGAENAAQKTDESVWKRLRLSYAAPFVVAAVLMIVLLPNLPTDPAADGKHLGEEKIFLKGHAHLVIYKKSAQSPGEVVKLKNGARADEGDVLQISYIPAGKSFGVILSVDGRGSITFHLPEEHAEKAESLQNEKTYLPHSYELDDAPDFERFFFITSKSPMNMETVRKAAAALIQSPDRGFDGDLELPETYEQNTYLIKKGRRSER